MELQFKRNIDSTISSKKGTFLLNFYVPKDWQVVQREHGAKKFPVVVNFHGGRLEVGSERWVNC